MSESTISFNYKDSECIDKHCIFDLSSGLIIKTKDPLKEVINLQDFSKERVSLKLKDKFSKSVIDKAFEAFNDLKTNYGFMENKVKGFGFPFILNKSNIKSFIKGHLGQLIIGATNQCNLRCRYCSYSGHYIKDRVHSNDYMNFETAWRAVKFFMDTATRKDRFISFYGGEPLLVFEIIEKIVNQCKEKYQEKTPNFGITTNGTLINKKIARFLIENQIYCYVSLDGPRDIHDKYRVFPGGDGSFDKVIGSLNLIKELDESYFKDRIILQITLSPPYDIIKIKEFFETDKMLKESFFMINWVNTFNTTLFKNEDRSKWKLRESVDILEQEFAEEFPKGGEKNINIRFHSKLFLTSLMRIHKRKPIPEDGILHPNGACVPGGRRIFVNTKGEIKICEKLDNFSSIGDISKGFDYDFILYLLNKFIEFCDKKCKKCWAASVCDLCFVQCHDINDLSITEKEQFCRHRKHSISKELVLYSKIIDKNKSAFDELKARIDKFRGVMTDDG